MVDFSIKGSCEVAGVKVTRRGSGTNAEQTIAVEIPSIVSPEARAVLHLQGEKYAQYPGARVRVYVDRINARLR